MPHTAEDELRVMQRAFAEAGLTWDPEVPSQEVRRRDEARAEADHLRSALERIVEAYLTHSKPVLERMYVIAIDALRPHEDTDSPTVAEMHASYPPGTFERR